MNAAEKYDVTLHFEVGSMGLDCFGNSVGLGIDIACSH